MNRVAEPVVNEFVIRAVYNEHGLALRTYATRVLGGDRLAGEDVVQETLVRLWRNPHVLGDDRGSLRAWLLTVAHNLCVDQIRKRNARPAELGQDQAARDAVVPIQRDHADLVAASVTVRAALQDLSPDHREVIEAIWFKGQGIADTAAQLGVPAGTVKSRSYYALRALRAAMKPRDEV